MHSNLRGIAASGFAWTSIEAICKIIMKLIAMVFLTRLLLPEDFGLVALLTPIMAATGAIAGLGLSVAIVQRKGLTDQEASSAYWFQLGAAIVAAAVLAAAAPLLAEFFDHAVLAPMLWALLAGLIIRTSGAVIGEQLLRDMQLATLSKIYITAVFGSSLTSVAAAFAGLGPWAIVLGGMVNSALMSGGMWFASRWRPRLYFSYAEVAKLFPFGFRMLGANVLHSLNDGIYAFAIGRSLGVGELGHFNRSRTFTNVSIGVLEVVTKRVTLPIFSTLQDEPDRILRGLREVMQLTMLATAPAMLGFAVLAEPVVVVVFGEIWRPAATLVPAFCLFALFQAPKSALSQVIISRGHAHLTLRLSGLFVVLTGTFAAVTIPFGLLAIAWSAPVAAAVHLIAMMAIVRRLFEYSLVALMRDICAPFGCAVAMAAVVAFLSAFVSWPSHFVQVAILVPLGGALFVLLATLFAKENIRLLKPLLLLLTNNKV